MSIYTVLPNYLKIDDYSSVTKSESIPTRLASPPAITATLTNVFIK